MATGRGTTKDGEHSYLFKATEIQDYDIAPGGKHAFCSLNKGRNWELARLDIRSGRMRWLLSLGQSLQAPDCSQREDLIAFHSDFEGDENHDVHVSAPDGSRARKVTDGVADNQLPQFSPDGRRIAFISNRKGDLENLYLVGVAGGRIKQLTSEKTPVREFAWSPDGSWITYAAGVGHLDRVSVVDVKSGKVKCILSSQDAEFLLSGDYGSKPAPWSPDGARLLFVSNENDAADIGEVALRGRKRRWLARSRNDKSGPRWSPDGKSLTYVEIRDPHSVVIEKTGERTRVVGPSDGVARGVRWADNDVLTFINGSSARPEEFFVSEGRRAGARTRFQKTALPKAKLSMPELIHYRSYDGRRIAALLHPPTVAGRRAGIVMPHGGPEMQTLDAWDQLPHMFASNGFAVIEPNYRGSIGYGREFLHLHDKDLGGGDLLDTVHAAKYLVRRGLADRDRVGYWGASYGGFLCLLALTKHPEVWAAGVSIVGFFDWETEFANERGYLQAYDRVKMGDPVKDRELFRDRSPIHFLDRLRAPLLLTASARDPRCPPTETRAVVEELRKLGKRFEYHEYPDEGHWPRKRRNLMDLYARSARFLDENIPG